MERTKFSRIQKKEQIGIVYLLHNTVNGRSYIGKSVQSFVNRFQQHCCAFEKGSKQYIHRAIHKYGKDAFICRVLEKTNKIHILNDLEKKWILLKHSHISNGGYNMTWGGDGGCTGTGRVMSEKHKEILRLANKGILRGPRKVPFTKERNEKISKKLMGNQNGKGSRLSEELKQQISERMKGNIHGKGSTQSEEHRKKLSILMKERRPFMHKKTTTVSEETKEKIRQTLSGRKLSEEHKQKIAEGGRRRYAK